MERTKEEQLVIEGWSKFPVVRPSKKPVIVLIDGEKINGHGSHSDRSGGTIMVRGKTIDSNQAVFWKYLEPSAV